MSRYLVERIAATPNIRLLTRDRGHRPRRRPGAAPRERDLGLPAERRGRDAADPQPLPLRRRRPGDELGAALQAQARPRGLRADRRGGAGRRAGQAAARGEPARGLRHRRRARGLGQAGRRRDRRGRGGGRARSTPRWRRPTRRPDGLGSDAAAPSAASCALLARPVRTARGRRGVVLQPYRGYGSAERIFVIGRAFWQRTDAAAVEAEEFRDDRAPHPPPPGARRADPRPLLRRRAGGRDRPRRLFPRRDGAGRAGAARPALAPARARDARAASAWRPGPTSIIPPDAGADGGGLRHRRHGDAYRRRQQGGDALAALRRGRRRAARSFPASSRSTGRCTPARRGDECNPMLYVSRAPWGIYDILEEFFQQHEIPVGPDPVPARMGDQLEAPAAAAGGRPQARS